jgi:hypothetical protein
MSCSFVDREPDASHKFLRNVGTYPPNYRRHISGGSNHHHQVTGKVRSNRNASELYSEYLGSNLDWNTILPEDCGTFLNHFTQMPRQYLTLGRDRFLPHILSKSSLTNQLTIRRYVIRVNCNVVKHIINK